MACGKHLKKLSAVSFRVLLLLKYNSKFKNTYFFSIVIQNPPLLELTCSDVSFQVMYNAIPLIHHPVLLTFRREAESPSRAAEPPRPAALCRAVCWQVSPLGIPERCFFSGRRCNTVSTGGWKEPVDLREIHQILVYITGKYFIWRN